LAVSSFQFAVVFRWACCTLGRWACRTVVGELAEPQIFKKINYIKKWTSLYYLSINSHVCV